VSNGDQALSFIYLIALLVLVGSAFAVRRVPLGQSLKMFLAWALIFLAVFVAFTLKDDFMDLGKRVMAEVRGESGVERRGEAMRIRQGSDGHFWVKARVNGQEVRFLVDSGATTTSISSDTARRTGITPDSAFPTLVETANGTVAVQRGRAARIAFGSIERTDVRVHIFEGAGDMNVLGMNFLSSLSSWGVEGRWLVLTP
jgi:aspartyl protease family protein